MHVAMALAVLIHKRMYATRPQRGDQLETRVRTIIWMMMVRVMEMIAKLAVLVMSVARAVVMTLGKSMMRRV